MSGIYLASAIDQNPSGIGSDVLDLATDDLRALAQVSWVYNPKKAFEVGPGEMDSGIRDINACALEASSVVLAFLQSGVPSVGVPMEIERALLLGKPVVLVSDLDRSWMLVDDRIHRYSTWTEEVLARVGTLAGQGNLEGYDLPIQTTSPSGRLPTRGHDDDAGLDLYVSEDVDIPPGEFRDVPCGIRVGLPSWSWGLITGRSSTLRNRSLLVSQGVIDAGYRGEMFAGVFNMGGSVVEVKTGERLAQLILFDNRTAQASPRQVTSLPAGSRGENGFGSTGV